MKTHSAGKYTILQKQMGVPVKFTRIFQSESFEQGQIFTLTPEAGQHIGVVLRMLPGEKITIFCGDNREFQATITSVHKKKVTVIIDDIQVINRESQLDIHLAQAISKGDRMEWVIQKAVELGVKSITPLITARCVVRLDEERLEKKQQQWTAIAISACEQSGRNQLPIIHKATSINTYLENCNAAIKFILHPSAPLTFRKIQWDTNSIALLIGPEGGLNQNEIINAEQHLFKAISLGPRILRTETAAIAALSVLQAMCGDL